MKTTLYFTLTLITFGTLAFVPNAFAQDDSPEYVVRVIYVQLNDVEPQEDSVNTLKAMIKDIQTFYADEMERHGYGRKTFRLETDAADNVIVHHLKGNFPYDGNTRDKISERLDLSQKIIYLIWVDRYDPNKEASSGGGVGAGESVRGTAWVFPLNFDSGVGNLYRVVWETIAHEIGHAFGLPHDFRSHTYIMSYGGRRSELSSCAAKWLDTQKYFNPIDSTVNDNTEIQMLPPTLDEPPATIRFKFEISDPDGLHRVILYAHSGIGLIECKQLSGYNSTVEFITNEIYSEDKTYYRLLVMDEHGNFKDQGFKIDIINLLPPSEVVPIPDSNLAAAIRETLRLAPGSTITQLDMLFRLRKLSVNDRRITDLTGLEHAINLNDLRLSFNQIEDITPLSKLTKLQHLQLNGNQIEDITPLSKLTKLQHLQLNGNQIEDITPLSKLTKLRHLSLSDDPQIRDLTLFKTLTNLYSLSLINVPISDLAPLTSLTKLEQLSLGSNQFWNPSPIRDISPVAEMTQLHVLNIIGAKELRDISPLAKLAKLIHLNLVNNQISDVSPLTGLINLKELYLHGNPIKNRKPLFELLEKNPDVKIYLKNNREPLPVNLSHFRAERTDAGVILKWTTESEIDNAGFYIYRSETRDGEFKVVNPTMIQGAGTTGERNEYMWTDTSAKPNTVYFYQIEDISHTGVRKQLATVRLRGLVSANGKLTTRWADLKMQE
ncbi:MAG: leucine-rich repeat domain-containing protein [Candidatus Poribacteria bacterium]|nr:leucine-rich repeat domain-containing protein [Candidatus Poribacteria bacterium]